MSIDDTLAERGSRYGEFPGHADITQNLKRTMGKTPGWGRLADDQKEALEMMAHKIGRILNGDPNYIDSWTDIAGYARLVEKRLIAAQAATPDAVKPLLKGSPKPETIAELTKRYASLQRTVFGQSTCNCLGCQLTLACVRQS